MLRLNRKSLGNPCSQSWRKKGKAIVHDEELWTKDRALGTPQEDVYQEDRSVSRLTRKQRDDRYDLNQLRTEPWMPNQDERRVIKMS